MVWPIRVSLRDLEQLIMSSNDVSDRQTDRQTDVCR